MQLVTKTRLPVVSAWREFPEAGGLLSYGMNVTAMFRRSAVFVDKILKGGQARRSSYRAGHHVRTGRQYEDR